MLPATGIEDTGLSPDAGGPIKIKKPTGAIPGGMLDHKMTIEQDRLQLRKQRVLAVYVIPFRLNHPNSFVGKVVDGLVQDIVR